MCLARYLIYKTRVIYLTLHSINDNGIGCASLFPNATKLKEHMRSHTQEKMLACPTCGGLFSNRTRFVDHCRRQIPMGS